MNISLKKGVKTMPEYIERSEAIKELHNAYEYEYPTASGAFDEFASTIVPNVLRNIPAADVVEVVRCKDCKHWYSPMNDDAHYCNLKHGLVGIVAEEDYCSYGERSGSE